MYNNSINKFMEVLMSRKNGDISKQALLDAAGKLFAQKGITSVKLSEIAKEASVDACMIHYHFGGKDGLILAVISRAVARWEETDMRKFYQDNLSLLNSREGQRVFITGLVESVFRTFGNGKDGDPGKSMLLQLLQYPSDLREKVIDIHVKPLMAIFCDIYKKITGSDDFESAFCWFMLLICPQYLNTASPGMIDLFHPDGKVSGSFGLRLQHVTTQVLLNGFGLN